MSERLFYLLTYDIADPKRLVKIAKIMESIGERVQDSVFEAYLNEEELKRILKRVERVMVMEEDSLRIYLICAACRMKIRCVGVGKVTSPPGVRIV
ncbi:MAG: CRISPR-associated protein Cas2 [Anaerolineae bacterium]|jgi:CRISPR-associated protein Cas2|nr:MAG: CRISPR-associated protein Cas2 [Anaerolineae bacterium]